MLLIYGHKLVLFAVPNNVDIIDESFEPLKTLKFVHSLGRTFHKWGPMPNLVYAPLYAPFLGYWHLTGDLGRPSTDYPYGLARPFGQQGLLIVVGRCAGVVIGLLCLAVYARALVRLTGSSLAVCLALLFCVATSPAVIIALVSTKPDGLMLAFLAASMAAYASIVADGLTKWRGFWLSACAVFSISCKELTAPAFVVPYVGIALAGWRATSGDRHARRRFLGDFAFTVAAGVITYLVVNVLYAPGVWLERMRWFRGPGGPNAAIWTSPGYSTRDYINEIVKGLIYDLGFGGLAIVLAAAVLTAAFPIKHRVLVWLPPLGFFTIVVLQLGYMPSYMLVPINVLLVLPVSAALAYAGTTWLAGGTPTARVGVAALAAVLLAPNLWAANYGWATSRWAYEWVAEQYATRNLTRTERIQLSNLWVRQTGASRLSYLGYTIDDRALGDVATSRESLPDVFLTSALALRWLEEFKRNPARTRMMADTGYSYDQFPGYEAIGYHLVEKFTPRLLWPLDIPWIPQWIRAWYPSPDRGQLLIYRRQ
jgi:hypothetical protein